MQQTDVRKFFRILNYFWHCLSARHTGGYGVHSPFLYSFVQYVIMEKHPYYVFDEIEKERHLFLQDNGFIDVQDYGSGKNRHRSIADIARLSLKSAGQAQLLFRIVRYLNCRNILELGTSLGITTLYLASVDTGNSCITIEGCSNTAAFARKLFEKYQADNIKLIIGNLDKILPETLQKSDAPDFIFIDANHRYNALMQYFDNCLNFCTPKTIIVIDDIYWSAGMLNAWKEIKKHAQVTATIDLYHMGIVFLNPGLTKYNYKIRFK